MDRLGRIFDVIFDNVFVRFTEGPTTVAMQWKAPLYEQSFDGNISADYCN